MRNSLTGTLLVTVSYIALSGVSVAEEMIVDGVAGLSNIGSSTYFGMWIPVEEGAVINGVRLYNNDESAPVESVFAQAGVLKWPGVVEAAVPVANEVHCGSSGWCEVEFSTPVSTECEGLYLYFKLPVGASYEATGYGGGFGLGISQGDGTRKCWLSGNGEDWNPMKSSQTFAVQALFSPQKSSIEAIVLGRDGPQDNNPDLISPSNYSLNAFPNPFNPKIQIKFNLPKDEMVGFEIFDIRGMRVKAVRSQSFSSGSHSFVWNGANDNGVRVPSGVYFVKMSGGNFELVRQIVLVK